MFLSENLRQPEVANNSTPTESDSRNRAPVEPAYRQAQEFHLLLEQSLVRQGNRT